jgi:hypothetical protein
MSKNLKVSKKLPPHAYDPMCNCKRCKSFDTSFNYDEVRKERLSQILTFGEQNHPNGTGSAYDEMRSTDARQRCDRHSENGNLTWKDILKEEVYEALAEKKGKKIRAELIQVMAVCQAWIECIDRKKTSKKEK